MSKENLQAVYLGRAIACARIEQGMKRKNLVEASGISYPFLAEVENGHKWPSFQMLGRLAVALRTDVRSLLARAMQIGEDFPVVQNATPSSDSMILPCGCEWVGEFPVNPWLDEQSEFIPTTLVCGCQWFGSFPGRDAWLAQAVPAE